METWGEVNSESMGDPAHFRDLAELEVGLAALPAAPTEEGRVDLLVTRGEGGQRLLLGSAWLSPEGGMPGDAWGRRVPVNPEAQLAVMETPVAGMIAAGQPLTLFGDNLFVTLDLSAANLPVGSRLQIGEVEVVVTPKAHNGCLKFKGRFGGDALKLVSVPTLRPRNLRGVYWRVERAGVVRVGDVIKVLERAQPA